MHDPLIRKIAQVIFYMHLHHVLEKYDQFFHFTLMLSGGHPSTDHFDFPVQKYTVNVTVKVDHY